MPSRRPSAEKPSRTSERLQLGKAAEASKQSAAPQGVSKRKRFRRPRQRKSCHLFKLPAELRNIIYRHVLVSGEEIKLKPKGPGEPALLRVCRGVRKEARSIYYTENKFRLSITAFNGVAFTHFARQYRIYRHLRPQGNSNITFLIDNDPHWENLVAWVKDYFLWAGLRPDLEVKTRPSDHIVNAAFNLADAVPHWGYYGWATVEKSLEAFRDGLKGTCSPWVRNYDKED
ncbi:hypothetical protein LTR78_000599 [Recurvomyces mirabilis]|uniref:Uncharacterized protein n=1 Tax=Recurvomyces mirabilis TaxID=574656 RepID=A0AAE0WYC3_9PEZI|nr:hypothetical protein LTR78_000599 [Recurvomyces mirabilis]KAK5162253.1 hypothetical protein LTS14_000600 [Recurvomyces mirabilis]